VLFGWFNCSNTNVNETSSIVSSIGNVRSFKSFRFALPTVQLNSSHLFVLLYREAPNHTICTWALICRTHDFLIVRVFSYINSYLALLARKKISGHICDWGLVYNSTSTDHSCTWSDRDIDMLYPFFNNRNKVLAFIIRRRYTSDSRDTNQSHKPNTLTSTRDLKSNMQRGSAQPGSTAKKGKRTKLQIRFLKFQPNFTNTAIIEVF